MTDYEFWQLPKKEIAKILNENGFTSHHLINRTDYPSLMKKLNLTVDEDNKMTYTYFCGRGSYVECFFTLQRHTEAGNYTLEFKVYFSGTQKIKVDTIYVDDDFAQFFGDTNTHAFFYFKENNKSKFGDNVDFKNATLSDFFSYTETFAKKLAPYILEWKKYVEENPVAVEGVYSSSLVAEFLRQSSFFILASLRLNDNSLNQYISPRDVLKMNKLFKSERNYYNSAIYPFFFNEREKENGMIPVDDVIRHFNELKEKDNASQSHFEETRDKFKEFQKESMIQRLLLKYKLCKKYNIHPDWYKEMFSADNLDEENLLKDATDRVKVGVIIADLSKPHLDFYKESNNIKEDNDTILSIRENDRERIEKDMEVLSQFCGDEEKELIEYFKPLGEEK